MMYINKAIRLKSVFRRVSATMLLLTPMLSYGQIGDYQKFSDIRGSDLYDYTVKEDLKYGVGKTKYRRLNASGNYDLITQKTLELDLFLPQTPSSAGKRAVIIMIPSGGRSGCRGGGVKFAGNGNVDLKNGCSQETIVRGDRVDQEGINFNHLNNSKAKQYAQRGMVVASVVTRYTYENGDLNKDGSNRWFRTANGTKGSSNPARLLTNGSAHLEFLATDIKRAVRWLAANANKYNIDPNYIFVEGGSGAAKMASVATVTNEKQLIVDDPANIDVAFERRHNNWDFRNSTPGIKGAILRKGDLNGNYHMTLMDSMSENTDSFMLWTGTADKSIVHGMSEVIEEKCDIIGTCSTQLFSLSNKTHSTASFARYPHTLSGDQTLTAHVHDFIVNTIDKDKSQLPVISITQNNNSVSESAGNARIKVVRSGDTGTEVKFTIAADQMREVTLENAKRGSFDLITKYVAKSSNSDGLVMYDDSTGYAYEDKFGGNLRKKSDRVSRHRAGKGSGEYTEISSGDNRYHSVDFTGKVQVLTIPAGQTSATFNVAITNDGIAEDNECFKVRLLNAYGASIGNSVETITIKDDDKANPNTNAVCGNAKYKGETGISSGGSPAAITLTPANVSINEGQTRTLTLKSNKVVSNDVSVSYQTVSGTASSADYRSESGVAIIRAGTDRVSFDVQTTQDNQPESNEKFTVELSQINSGDARLGSASISTLTILDNDSDSAESLPVISLSRDEKSIQEGKSFTMLIEASDVSTEDMRIEYQTKRVTASTKDFRWFNKTAVIPKGKKSVSISVETTDDNERELNERFNVELNSVVSRNAKIGSKSTTVVIIVDNDSTSTSIINLSRDLKSVHEGNGFPLSITSNKAVANDVSIEYQTRRGTASKNDYIERIKVAVIPKGQRSVSVFIETVEDDIVEFNERFRVELNSIVSGDAQIGNDKTTEVIIIDDDECDFDQVETPNGRIAILCI